MQEENDQEQLAQEKSPENEVTYNFKWMLLLLIVGIVGSFVFALFMK